MAKRVLPEIEKYVACPGDGRILDFYDGQFEAVYVVLHPFIRPKTIDIDRFTSQSWPSKNELLDHCEPVLWEQVRQLAGFQTLAQMDVALRTSISGLKKEFEDEALASRLEAICEAQGLQGPPEGDVPQLLENRLYGTLKTLGHEWLWLSDEFGTERKLHWIDDLVTSEEIPCHGHVFTHEHDLLLTTHWDSHCSFLCSSRALIERILAEDPFEGFFCTDKTHVYWGLHDGPGQAGSLGPSARRANVTSRGHGVASVSVEDAPATSDQMAVEVVVTLNDGRRRLAHFATPESLTEFGDWVPGTKVRFHVGLVVIEKITEDLIRAALVHLDRQGDLMSATRPLK